MVSFPGNAVGRMGDLYLIFGGGAGLEALYKDEMYRYIYSLICGSD